MDDDVRTSQDKTAETPTEGPKKSRRGFASMTAERRRELGSRGGHAAHERGTANRFTPESASAAGRIPHERGTAHKWTSEQAREAGRKGGTATRRTRRSQLHEQRTDEDERNGEP